MKNNGLLNILLVVAVTLAILYGINYLTSNQALLNYGEVAPSKDEPNQEDEVKAEETPARVGRETMTGYRAGDYQPGPYPGSEGVAPGQLESTQSGCPVNQHLTPDDLLPKDESSAWAKMHPTGEGSLESKNFLQAGQHVGIDTVGQTLRNANLQLRSEPPNPRLMVSPWLNSTIESDTNRRPFELGTC